MISVIYFLILYFGLFLFATFAIVGWYLTTRGEWETLPDGTRIAKGRIFRRWHLFWNQTKDKRKIIFYQRHLLEALSIKAIPLFESIYNSTLHVGFGNEYLFFPANYIITDQQKEKIELELSVKMKIEKSGNRISVVFFKEYEQYLFPEWIRHPVATCVTCFSSIYGSIFYWSCIYQIKGLFSWSLLAGFSKWFFWIVFCFSLSCTTTFVVKTMNKK